MDFDESKESVKRAYNGILRTVRLDSTEDYERFMAKADKVWPPVTEARAITAFDSVEHKSVTQQLIADVIKAKEILGAGDNVWVYGKAARAIEAIAYVRQLPEYKGKSVYEIVESLESERAATKSRLSIYDLATNKFVQVYGIEPLMEVGCLPECGWQSVEGAHACKNLLREGEQTGLATAEPLHNKSAKELAKIATDFAGLVGRNSRYLVCDPDVGIATALANVAPGPLRDDLALLMMYRGWIAHRHDNARVIDVRSTPYVTCVLYKFDTPVEKPTSSSGHCYEYALETFPLSGMGMFYYHTFVENETDREIISPGLVYDLQWCMRDDPEYFEALGEFTADEYECKFSEQFIMGSSEDLWVIAPDWREKLEFAK